MEMNTRSDLILIRDGKQSCHEMLWQHRYVHVKH
jgi:hypothetical protein